MNNEDKMVRQMCRQLEEEVMKINNEGKERRKKEKCQMCGKQLIENNMFWKKKSADKAIYLCCQTCYEQFFGKPYSSNPEIGYE